MLLATAFISIAGKVLFDIPMWMGALAVVLELLPRDRLLPCHRPRPTSPPVGPLGKISQLIFRR
jgi:hypothetical protein